MTRSYLWRQKRTGRLRWRAAPQSTRSDMKGTTHTQGLQFWDGGWNYLLCALFCSCCIWLPMNRDILSSAPFPQLPGRFVRWWLAFKSLAGQPGECRPFQTEGKCGWAEAAAACYQHQWLHRQHIVSPASGQPACRSGEKMSYLWRKRRGREAKSRVKLCTDGGSVQCACQSKHFHSTNNLFWIVCVFIVCNVYISLQLFAHINKRFN